MDRLTLTQIDEGLESSEVAELCFLCRDFLNIKQLEGIDNARMLFLRLEERGLMDNYGVLSELLRAIHRKDLLNVLEKSNIPIEETDASPFLSEYRLMLYGVYEDMTKDNFAKMKFLLSDKLGKRQIELCKTSLDIFSEMEKKDLLSSSYLCELEAVVRQLDQQLVSIVNSYNNGERRLDRPRSFSNASMGDQHFISSKTPQSEVDITSIRENQPSVVGQPVSIDARPRSSSTFDPQEYYILSHRPRGLCAIFNNENFVGPRLKHRAGSKQDEENLERVFIRFGFTVKVYSDMTAQAMKQKIEELGRQNFLSHDALVVCVLSHGNLGCVYGIDEGEVPLRTLMQPFTSGRAPTLAGKPKAFFIQACQGLNYQYGSVPCPPRPEQPGTGDQSHLEADAGPVEGETVPTDADFLLGMATVPNCKSFRNTKTGSIYIQELCKQLVCAADSPAEDDILSVLTRVNREVGKRQYVLDYSQYKQMPEPKYTLTKKLVFRYVGKDPKTKSNVSLFTV